MSNFNESAFKQKVDGAINQVKTILENTRAPTYAADVDHSYDDKYLLAEFVANSSIAAILRTLDEFGISPGNLSKLVEWQNSGSAVSLRFTAEEKCSFTKKQDRKVESAEHVTEYSGMISGTKKEKIVTTITEYFWQFEASYSLFAFKGNNLNKEDCIQLCNGNGEFEIITRSDVTPKPKVSQISPIDVNITWLLQQVNSKNNKHLQFKINRLVKSCKTPRRNDDVEALRAFTTSFSRWNNAINNYFTGRLFPVQTNHGLNLSTININGLFVPVVPLFESNSTVQKKTEDATKINFSFALFEEANSSNSLLSLEDLNKFLQEQHRTINEKNTTLAKVFPETKKLITCQAARISVYNLYLQELCMFCCVGIDYIEHMLYTQLIAAIGKIVSPIDFADYMKFHYRKLFKEEYQPTPFCYAIRRPDHFPEGILSIEASQHNATAPQPISTLTRKSVATTSMQFPISASSNVSFYGDRFVHGYVENQFSNNTGSQLHLYARARQFSSFILLVGRIAGPSLFEPISGIIIQNKDDLKIPLMLEQIPTPKAFRDAIESLSPEQQRFAKAFRSMQLNSTLFGLCVIQIKPQLEKVLNLPERSLTKEIKLTQELMELFIKYQIPCDLLSFSGDASASKNHKLAKVKEHVAEMLGMINEEKERELKEKEEEERFRQMAELERIRMEEEEMELAKCLEEKQCMAYECESFSAKPQSTSFFGKMKSAVSNALPSFVKQNDYMMDMPKSMPVYSEASAPMPDCLDMDFCGEIAVPSSNNNNNNNSNADSNAPTKETTTTTTTTTTEKPKAEQQQQQQEHQPPKQVASEDYTVLPVTLNANYEKFDVDNAVRPTIINPGTTWEFKSQKALLAAPTTQSLCADEQKEQNNKAFDLLDALSKSGILCFEHATLHVIVAATHCFDKNVIDTVIQDNVNPIEKVERTAIIVASTIHKENAQTLLNDNQVDRVKLFSANVFDL